MKNLTFANRWNADLIDENYKIWLDSPDQLDSDWRAFFEGFELAQESPTSKAGGANNMVIGEASIIHAINSYRALGHSQAKINPLDPSPKKNPALAISQLGLGKEDLDKEFFTGNYLEGKTLKTKEILEGLEKTYCGSVGCEYMHIQDTVKRRWLESHMEPMLNQPQFSREQQIHILRKINRADIFERFLHTRYVGQKRFSLEGGETLIPALDAIIEKCPALGVKEVSIGMAHRGRLNVLANILGKSYNFIFREFSENYIPQAVYGDGDVKYHLGYIKQHQTISGNNVRVSLAANPSHLEAVNPVVEGLARARQRILSEGADTIDRSKVLPVLLHGDAAIAGQGIVPETLNLCKLEGYTTGGTLHIVINNQIGFTTSPEQSRSSRYCTDIAKTIEAPIFHVNGDDPLSVVMVCELALKYRQEFGDDVLIDMYCYRKHGHNEADEPSFTQPTLYKQISQHKSSCDKLAEQLINDGVITPEESKGIKDEFEAILKNAFDETKKAIDESKIKGARGKDSGTPPQAAYSFNPVKTAVAKKDLEKVAKALTRVPEGFNVNPKVQRQMDTKWKAFQEGEGFDWAFGEALAFGTLLTEAIPVRLSGQDSERGTFSHRHSVLYDGETQERYVPLLNIEKGQAQYCVHNSSLSEAAVLGFDYGYSLDYPKLLCIWEAQFGDFANGAQSIIDQFIIPGESKWQQASGLVMLLPHGYEGQGPEHSSARLERFLQACADENIQVCNVTTPAQFFHLLRRQMKQLYRKPLIVMAPKSLLRNKACTSTLKDLTSGQFECILNDPKPSKKPERVVLCSGKVYYDLLNFRDEQKIKNTNIIRIEQLYPLDQKTLKATLDQYKGYKKLVWCQEEPQNMGAWNFISSHLYKMAGYDAVQYVGRNAAASPATGALAIHKIEQEALVESAFYQ